MKRFHWKSTDDNGNGIATVRTNVQGEEDAIKKLIDEAERVVLAAEDDGVYLPHLCTAIEEAKAYRDQNNRELVSLQKAVKMVVNIIETKMYTDNFEIELNRWLNTPVVCRPTPLAADLAEGCRCQCFDTVGNATGKPCPCHTPPSR